MPRRPKPRTTARRAAKKATKAAHPKAPKTPAKRPPRKNPTPKPTTAPAPKISERVKVVPIKKRPSPATKVRRANAAAKLLEGKSVDQVAIETGVSRATAYRDAQSEECRYQVALTLDRRAGQLEQLLDKSLERLSEALDAKRLVILSKGDGVQQIVDVEDPAMAADHAVRIKAVGQVARLTVLGRPLPNSEDEDKPITFEQFEHLLGSFLRRRSA